MRSVLMFVVGGLIVSTLEFVSWQVDSIHTKTALRPASTSSLIARREDDRSDDRSWSSGRGGGSDNREVRSDSTSSTRSTDDNLPRHSGLDDLSASGAKLRGDGTLDDKPRSGLADLTAIGVNPQVDREASSNPLPRAEKTDDNLPRHSGLDDLSASGAKLRGDGTVDDSQVIPVQKSRLLKTEDIARIESIMSRMSSKDQVPLLRKVLIRIAAREDRIRSNTSNSRTLGLLAEVRDIVQAHIHTINR